MTNQAKQTVPMAILTGYLGAGKTTLINRILNANHNMKIAVLVNDFGAINIDARLIVGVEGEKITLSNGCICCTIRGDLVTAIDKLVSSDSPPDYIIIESSGVSDPSQVVLTFNRSSLRLRVRIDSIIAVVDAEHFAQLGEKPQRLLREQVRVSDIVILNKVDLVNEDALQKARDWINSVIDKARVIEAVQCDVPLEALIGNASYNPQTAFDGTKPGVHAHDVEVVHDHEHNDHSLVFATWSWETDDVIDLNAMRSALDNLPKSIFRAKGILNAREIPNKQVVLQLVGNRVTLTEGDDWDDKPRKTSIVVIGDIGSVDKIVLEQQFEETRANTVPEKDISKLVDGVLQWLRGENKSSK